MPDQRPDLTAPSQLAAADEFIRNLCDSGLMPRAEIEQVLHSLPVATANPGVDLARLLIDNGRLSEYQVERIRRRKLTELVIGNYEVLDRLGAGGMGKVYKARHRRMKRIVALKLLTARGDDAGNFVQRFQREIEAVARLSHPNIVMAFDADEAEAGPFLVMEYVNGRNLHAELKKNGPMPVQQAVDCALQVARALDYAHGQGIIHRDIKPANLLRDTSGVVKVADLGLARFYDPHSQTSDSDSITQVGTVMGTADYMSPEQAAGLSAVDHRADIYSLGCTLFFLLTGRPPFVADTSLGTVLLHRESPIPSLCAARPSVPPALDAVFQRMLAKKPDERYGSMAEVMRALEAVPPVAEEAVRRPLDSSSVLTDSFLATERVPRPTPARKSPPPAESPSGTVLLVEPSRTQSLIIRQYLQELGRTDVRDARSGREALELVTAVQPQVVISSMHLRDMTGLDLARQLAANPALGGTSFVLIASQSEGTEVLLPPDQVVLLHKPFDAAGLSQALATAIGSAAPSTAAPWADAQVLIVDDSTAARAHIRGVLVSLGFHHLTEAGDGEAALSLLGEQPFDLVITDYHMPRRDGRELIEFIRQRSTLRSLPIILVTTETDPARLEDVRRLGVSAICEKAFDPAVVGAIMEGIFREVSKRQKTPH